MGTMLGRLLAFRSASQPAKVSVGHGASVLCLEDGK